MRGGGVVWCGVLFCSVYLFNLKKENISANFWPFSLFKSCVGYGAHDDMWHCPISYFWKLEKKNSFILLFLGLCKPITEHRSTASVLSLASASVTRVFGRSASPPASTSDSIFWTWLLLLFFCFFVFVPKAGLRHFACVRL